MTINSNLFVCVVLCLLKLILGVTDGLAVPKANQHACIIGAGLSGMATTKYLQDFGINNFTVLEATSHVGGTWRFDPHIGANEDGLPIFTSQYKNLRTNTPRQTMEFAGFPFPEDTPSYPTGACYYQYLQQYAKEFDLKKFIQPNSLVTSVKWMDDHWKIHYMNSKTRSNHTETCNFVVVATGQYNKPNWPKFKGEENFKGKIIHSHDYKEPESYRNRKVLLVGAGPSGLDIATHLVDVTQKLVHSHHLVYNQPNFPETYVKKPDIKMFTSNGAIFEDDSFEEVDDVIYCTGYMMDHSFIDSNSELTLSGQFILPLYQQMVNIRRPSMLIIGIARTIIVRLRDVQAEYAAALIAGRFKLPPQDQMLKSWLSYVYYLHSIGKKINNVNLVGDLQDQYFANLTAEAGVTRAAPVLNEIREFNVKIRLDDLLHYRDYDFNITDDYHYERYYNPRKNLSCPYEIL